MQELKVIGVENGSLLAASDDGERFRIAIDEVLQSRIRQSKPETSKSPKLSPREVQAHIRSGMSAVDVATVTGAPLEYVQRFERPIIAEREHIVTSALGVPVHTAAEIDPLEGATFGAVIRERLASLGVSGERWASWKDPEDGWVIKLEFTADQIDHDARWSFDVRKHALAPMNAEATTLSQQGELRGSLIPRLRAVTPHFTEPDESRFDSGAFMVRHESSDFVGPDSPSYLEPVALGRPAPTANNSITISAINRSEEETPKDGHQTADLLETLRRRRGEREAANFDEGDAAEPHGDAGMRIVDVPLDGLSGGPTPIPPRPAHVPSPAATNETSAPSGPSRLSNTGPQQRPRKGRASMPSWDEIVFGARTDGDDLA